MIVKVKNAILDVSKHVIKQNELYVFIYKNVYFLITLLDKNVKYFDCDLIILKCNRYTAIFHGKRETHIDQLTH